MTKSAEVLKKQFTCLGKNTEKYYAFLSVFSYKSKLFFKILSLLYSFNRKEVTRINKNGDKIAKNISYMLQFIDSSSLCQVHYQILPIIFLN